MTIEPPQTTENSEILSVSSLPELVYERLRNDIASGALPPGRLSIRELSDRFGVSAIPVREALRLLEAQGLVSFRGKRLITINSLQVADVVEIFQIRSELECLAVRLSYPQLHTR
jgi:DNA-binding GntR family transcriptional regulator